MKFSFGDKTQTDLVILFKSVGLLGPKDFKLFGFQYFDLTLSLLDCRRRLFHRLSCVLNTFLSTEKVDNWSYVDMLLMLYAYLPNFLHFPWKLAFHLSIYIIKAMNHWSIVVQHDVSCMLVDAKIYTNDKSTSMQRKHALSFLF